MILQYFSSLEQLQQKFHILSEMDPRHIDDILPLICVEKDKLEQFKQILEEQLLKETIENPIYYFSGRLKVKYLLIMSFG